MGLLALLIDQTDEAAATRLAVERILESFDAEVGVLIGPEGVLTTVGLGRDREPIADVVAKSPAGVRTIDLPGLGTCHTAAVHLDATPDSARLVLCRRGGGEFGVDETLLLRGMAWVLGMALRPLRAVAALQERQRLLEQMAKIQNAIANRAPLPEVFDAVTEAARGLFGNELATLYLLDHGHLVRASVSTTLTAGPPRVPPAAGSSLGSVVYQLGTAVRTDNYPAAPYAVPELVAHGARSAMAAPVRENGAVAGSLVVVSCHEGHRFTEAQESILLTFADQVSVALSDARTLATAQDAIRDPVTGLPNRTLFLQRLDQAISRADSGQPVYVLFLDLDRFKLVNESLGHAAGDQLLHQVGRRLRACLRGNDFLARFGGDEFAVLVTGCEDATVRRIGDRLLAATQSPYLVAGSEIVVGGSIGMAGGTGADLGDLLRDADTAMYRAKTTGGGRLVIFEQSMRTSLVQRVGLESDLRRAVDNAGELFVVYQPIVRLSDGAVHAAEALVRWQHPTRGVVSPVDFIPLAEETGLIVSIGRLVLAAACAQAATWPEGVDGGAAPVSVNLSARQLLDPNLVADVRNILADTGIGPERLILEITESTLISDTSTVLDRLQQLRQLGIRLAVDDFGTGYSSLAYLRMFPVNFLKIDRSFVEGAAAGWQGEEFLRTIVRLAQTLSMTAIGEGIETAEQLRVLQRTGCELGQGFLYARPLAPDQLKQYLRTRPAELTAA